MGLMETVRSNMVWALKRKEMVQKVIYSNVLNALTLKQKELKRDLTPTEENEIIAKLVKQVKESISTCPSDRKDTLEQLSFELELLSSYMPKQLSTGEVVSIIASTVAELGLTAPLDNKSRGLIMKNLMPKVKGIADGKVVSEEVEKFLKNF